MQPVANMDGGVLGGMLTGGRQDGNPAREIVNLNYIMVDKRPAKPVRWSRHPPHPFFTARRYQGREPHAIRTDCGPVGPAARCGLGAGGRGGARRRQR
ncbi:hypothetical protein JCM13210_00770 [Thermaerobacter litoralis]